MFLFLKVKIKRSDLWVTSHDKLSDFSVGAWQRGDGESPWGLLAARAALAGAALGILAWSMASGGGAGPGWLLYLTNWGLLLLAALMLSALLVSCMHAHRTPPEHRPTPWYVALYWVLFNVTMSTALAITLLYWLLLYDPAVTVYGSAGALWLDVATHALNSALALGELAASRTPARLTHAWQPLLFAAGYVAFSGVYYAAGGTNMFGEPYIYPVLDWSRAGAAGAVAGGALAGVALLHAAVCALAAARDAAGRRCCRPQALRCRPHDRPLQYEGPGDAADTVGAHITSSCNY